MSYLTVREVAALLRVSDLTIRRWVWSGKLPALRVGRTLRIKQADVDRLCENGGQRAGSSAQSLRPGSARALLKAVEQCAPLVKPQDVEELERLITEGCERPGETGMTIG
jgi:excisionase family DNA binding protein